MISLKKVMVVARYTSSEIFKSKIVLYFMAFSLGIGALSYIASEFTFGVPHRVALDIGLGLSSSIGIIMAIFLGVSLISKEIENRTIYMILSRPITRFEFLLGKILGISLINLFNVLILGGFSMVIYWILGGEFEALIFWSYLFIILESTIILLIVILFSMVTNPILSVINTIVILFSSHVVVDIQNSVFVKVRPALKSTLAIIGFIIPQLEKLNVKNFVLYNKQLPLSYLLGVVGYSLLYVLALILLGKIVIDYKNLD